VVSLFKRNDTAIIRISDNGTGIPKDIQDKIFSPNFTTKQYGSGIGLLITKNIIQSVNGRIYFETVENEGTDFFVELDIQSIEQPAPSEVKSEANANMSLDEKTNESSDVNTEDKSELNPSSKKSD
jgi:signal transduction histidine kinase